MDNCEKILNVLKTNAGKEYKSPHKLQGDEAKQMESLYAVCKEGEERFFELVEGVARSNNMICSIHKSVLDGTRRKIRSYYWGELQEEKHLDSAESISIFAEKDANTNEVRFRVSLEIDGNRATPRELERHNGLLEFPKENDCIYALNEGAAKSLFFTNDVNEAKRRISSGEAKKVQLCVLIPQENKDDEKYIIMLDSAIKKIKKSYDRLIK